MAVEFNKAAFMLRLQGKVKSAVHAGAITLQTAVKEKLNLSASNISNGGTPSAPGMPPAKGSGALARSIAVVDVTVDPLKPTYKVGTNMVYARIQEYGGRVRAKKSKYLTIPIGAEGRRAAKQANGDIRKLDLRVVKTKKQVLLVKDIAGGKGGRGARMVPLFVLKKEVILPARPYMRPALAAMKGKIDADIAKAIANELKAVTA